MSGMGEWFVMKVVVLIRMMLLMMKGQGLSFGVLLVRFIGGCSDRMFVCWENCYFKVKGGFVWVCVVVRLWDVVCW